MGADPRGRVRRIVQVLEGAYGKRPWRSSGPGLDGLVRTILSQNTNDGNSGAAFRSLREAFADWDAVRRAPAARIAQAIRIAGLSNIKGPRIKRILQEIHADRGEVSLEFLRDRPPAEARAYLRRFKGVGPKTAACVLMFNFAMPVLPVDTHVHRVSQRLGLIGPRVSAEQAHERLEAIVPAEKVYAFHVLLIQHGREVCHRRSPQCGRCVLRRLCAFRQGMVPRTAKEA